MWNPLSTKDETNVIRMHLAVDGGLHPENVNKALKSYFTKKLVQTAIMTTVTVGAAYAFDKKFNKDN